MGIRIKDWDSIYENNRTRELKKMEWVPIPNKMDGEGYTTLIEDHPNGPGHFAAFIALVEIASRQPKELRGIIPQGIAGLSQSLAKKSRMPARLFDEAIPRLIQVQWIEEFAEISQEGAGLSQEGAPRTRAGTLPFPSLPFTSIPKKETLLEQETLLQPPTQKPTRKEFEEDWPKFWKPLEAKEKAFDAYKKARGILSRDELMAHVATHGPHQVALAKQRGGNPIHQVTWLNQCRWTDEISDIAPTNGHGPPRRFKTRQEEMMEEVMGEMK